MTRSSDSPQAQQDSPKMLRFVGPQHERHFTQKDLQRIDPAYDGGVSRFNSDNNFQLPADKFTEAVLEYLVADGEFVVQAADVHNQIVQDKLGVAGPSVYTGPLISAD